MTHYGYNCIKNQKYTKAEAKINFDKSMKSLQEYIE